MHYVILLSGEIQDDTAAYRWLDRADKIICADGGARHLRRLHRIPDLLIGDFDSISTDDMQWLKDKGVPVKRYPREKDATDSELALDYACSELPQPAGQHTLTLLGAMGSRPDHVLANQLLAAHYAQSGWRIMLTDGISCVYTMCGGQSLDLELPNRDTEKISVSLLPLTDMVRGVSCRGLKYPLESENIARGSTLGISNQVSEQQAEKGRKTVPVQIALREGLMLVITTPEA